MSLESQRKTLLNWSVAAGAGWLVLAAVILGFSFSPDKGGIDFFGVAGGAVFALFAVVGLLACVPRPAGGQRPAFVFAALQLTFVILAAMLALGNAAASLREEKISRWHREVPDYAAAYDEPLTIPGVGGYARPNVDLVMKAAKVGETVHFHTNNLGFRRKDTTTVEKPAGTFRILFPGDSMIVGYRIDTDETIGMLLERSLGERVAEGAFPEHITHIEILAGNTEDFAATWNYLYRQAEKLDPDLVIWNNCLANDFSQTVFQMGIPPNPPRAPFSIAEDGVPEYESEEEWPEVGKLREEWLGKDENRYPDYAFKSDAISRDRNYWTPDSVWALGKAVQRAVHALGQGAGYHGWNMAPNREDRIITPAFEETQLFLKPEHRHPVTDLSFDVAKMALDAYGEWSEKTGIPLMVATIPVRYQVVPQDYAATFVDGPLRGDLYDMRSPNRFVEAECKSQGLLWFDYTPAFESEGDEAYRLFMPLGDIHWTAEGHRAAAEAIEPVLADLIQKIASES